MTTISVPITLRQEEFIKDLIKRGQASNKAVAIRRAIDLLAEEEILNRLLRSQEDVKRGRVFRGDLKKILKKF